MQFLKSGLLFGGTGILHANGALAYSHQEKNIEKLIDANGALGMLDKFKGYIAETSQNRTPEC